MRTLRFLPIASVLLLMLAGCELFGPDDSIEVLQSLPDTTLHVGDGGYTIDLSQHFEISSEGPLWFDAGTDHDAVLVTVRGYRLEILPQAAGMATITVVARSGNAPPVEARFLVQVLCPTEPSSYEASYFPHAVGQTWSYDYREHNYPRQTSPFEITTTGLLTWQITHRADQCAQIDLEIAEVFEGQAERIFMGSADTTYVVAWTKTLDARLDGDRLIIEGYTDASYTGLDSLQWMYPRTAPDVIRLDSTTFCGFGGCTTIQYELQQGVGLTRWSYNFNHRDLYSKSLTLRE